MEETFVADGALYTGVRGKTIIDHRVRIQLELSLMEYILIDFIFNFYQAHPCVMFTEADIWKATGYHFDHRTKQILAELRARGMIQIVSSDSYYYLPGVAWQKKFNADASFDEFWELWQKVGSKQKAKEAYRKALKIIDQETLFVKAKEYIDFRMKQFGYHTTHAASYLNGQQWNDKLGEKSKQNTNDVPKQKIEKF